jgi:hypothetical protein
MRRPGRRKAGGPGFIVAAAFPAWTSPKPPLNIPAARRQKSKRRQNRRQWLNPMPVSAMNVNEISGKPGFGLPDGLVHRP